MLDQTVEHHIQSAQTAIKQYQTWQQDLIVPASSMQRLIDAIRMDLYVLSHSDIQFDSSDFTNSCLLLGTSLLRNESAGMELVIKLLNGNNEQQQAIIFTLTLLQKPTDQKLLQLVFQQNPNTHTTLLKLWEAQGIEIPIALLQTAVNQPGTQTRALHYAALQNYNLSLFNQHYQSTDEHNLAPAILGGLLRGDENAKLQLPKAISGATQTEKLLELAAISGNQSLENTVIDFCQLNPESIHFLGFYGTKKSTQELLNIFAKPQHAATAATAWRWVTDTVLTLTPSIQLVGSDKQTAAKKIPSVNEAQCWFDNATWQDRMRLFAGKQLSINSIETKLNDWCGRARYYCAILKKLEQQYVTTAK